MTTHLKQLAAFALALGAYPLAAGEYPVAASAAPMGPAKDPIFIGAQACGACHDGPKMGHQFSKWRLSAHAKAYVALALPESREITRLSGITEEPSKSRMCLGCHATASDTEDWERADGFHFADGMQCEACHGAGSEYASADIMKDPMKAMMQGLKMPKKDDCLLCHRAKGSHDTVLQKKPFDVEMAWQAIAHPMPKANSPAAKQEAPAAQLAVPATPPSPSKFTGVSEPAYKNPLNLALTPDGKELWVTCEASASVVVVDTATRKKLLEIAVGGQPTDVCFTPDGRKAFVSNRLDDSVSVVDVAARKAVGTLTVGNQPHGVLVDKQGKYLYVLNTSIDSISVFDVATLQEVKQLSASRSPWSLAQSPDGKSIFVTHALSRFVEGRAPSMSEVTVIDAEQATVKDRLVVKAANLLQGVAWDPSGDFAVITLLRTKNMVPMTRINHGWTISNGLGILWRDGAIDQVLLDQNNLCFPDPSAVCITPDGKYALVTSSSTDRVAVVDLHKLIAMLKAASPQERERIIPNHLGKSVEFVVAFISTQACPKGIKCSADGATAYVANTCDDSVTVIDLKKLETAGRVDLGGPTEISKHRRGERLFHSANIAFRRQFSCSTCHPDGHIDNIVYDIEDDGIGMGPIDNKTLRGIADMAPYKWTGINPSLKRQCGPRLAVYITRIQPFTSDQLTDLHDYLCSIPRPPNRYRKLGEDLTEAQRRGKKIFARSMKNNGMPIPVENRCITCHPPPLYMDGKIHDVGTKFPLDLGGRFASPQLLNIYDSAPYLHNGIAPTLEEIWTRYNPDDQHGVSNDMTKDQLNDLVEFLKTI
jgi:YVTN family beta-propeller protein